MLLGEQGVAKLDRSIAAVGNDVQLVCFEPSRSSALEFFADSFKRIRWQPCNGFKAVVVQPFDVSGIRACRDKAIASVFLDAFGSFSVESLAFCVLTAFAWPLEASWCCGDAADFDCCPSAAQSFHVYSFLLNENILSLP